MMMQQITPFTNNNRLVSPLKPPLLSNNRGVNFRSGKAKDSERSLIQTELKNADENPKKILSLVKEWLAVNHPTHPVSDETLLNLLNQVKQTNTSSADAIWQQVQQQVGTPLKEGNAYVEALKKQIQDCVTGGKTEVNNWLKAFVILQYVPSTIVTIMTTIWINKELEKAKKITKKEEKLLNNQEMARQLVGVVIHCVQAGASFALVDGIALAGKKNHVVRKQAEQWVAKTEGWKGLNQLVGKGLHKTADGLQWSWNTLNEGHNKTGLSLGFVILSNLLSYGIMRPLLVNTTFIGIKEATEVPATPQAQTPASVPASSSLPSVSAPTYTEQVRFPETIPTLVAIGAGFKGVGSPPSKPSSLPSVMGVSPSTLPNKALEHVPVPPSSEAPHKSANHRAKHYGRFQI